MIVQNGSAVLVALLAQQHFDDLGVSLASLAFTLVYFVFVEAMAKTFGVLHTDRAALALAPIVWVLSRLLALPTRALIGLANVLLPGKGLKEGPFVSERDIRSMAEVGLQEGSIDETERTMIHSIFDFSDTTVHPLMIPRPDVVAVDASTPLAQALDTIVAHDVSRLPVYRTDLDRVEGILYAKDVLKVLHQGVRDQPLAQVMRPAHFVPETTKASALLRDMRREHFHMALVVDEYGSTTGVITMEDLLEELVGDIADEHDVEESDVLSLGEGRYRVDASLPIHDLNRRLGVELPYDRWNTVGGLLYALLGTVPTEGESVELEGLRFTAERVHRRRVATVLVTHDATEQPSRHRTPG
jgi:CBS domain containing-hemolysin-like protein